jgi:DNA-binding transcriptional ArsR family regulator
MVTTSSLAAVAALVGDPARAAMLQALMDGRALTAGELAAAAGVAPQTASGHLGRLAQAGLVTVARQGRHRYHRLAGAPVARMLEGLMLVAAAPAPPRTGPRDEALRLARTCYDHIAGRLGVALADALAERGWVVIEGESGLVTPEGRAGLGRLGIGIDDPARGGRAQPCRPCLDWSERRPHLAGRLGAALCRHGLERGWVRRQAGSRALAVSPEGHRAWREAFGVSLAQGP